VTSSIGAGPDQAAPESGAQDSRRWLALAVIAVSQLMVVLDASIVTIALPSAQADLGITDAQVRVLLIAGAACLVALTLLGRPLLFATLDPAVARAGGVPVRLVGAIFLLLLGAAAAGTSQVTGSLLVFALLVAPAASAVRLTANPAAGVTLSIALAVTVTWLGEGVAYFSPYPIGFWVTTFAFGCSVTVTVWPAWSEVFFTSATPSAYSPP